MNQSNRMKVHINQMQVMDPCSRPGARTASEESKTVDCKDVHALYDEGWIPDTSSDKYQVRAIEQILNQPYYQTRAPDFLSDLSWSVRVALSNASFAAGPARAVRRRPEGGRRGGVRRLRGPAVPGAAVLVLRWLDGTHLHAELVNCLFLILLYGTDATFDCSDLPQVLHRRRSAVQRRWRVHMPERLWRRLLRPGHRSGGSRLALHWLLENT